jgi:hypothetical protein
MTPESQALKPSAVGRAATMLLCILLFISWQTGSARHPSLNPSALQRKQEAPDCQDTGHCSLGKVCPRNQGPGRLYDYGSLADAGHN